MNKNHILSKTIAAAASVVLCATAAHAATLVNGTTGAGELFIGVHATGGTGVGKSVVIDAGSVSALSLLNTGQTQSLGSIGADLAATFGATWYDRTDLLWSAAAGVQNSATADPTNTLYGGVSGTDAFPLSTVGYTRAANGSQSSVAGRILTAASGVSGSFTTAAAGASSNIALETASDANSWASWMPGGTNSSSLGNNPFGGFSNPTGQAFEQAFTAGTLASGVEGALDVYRMFKTGVADGDLGNATSGAGSYQFTVAIDNTGALTAENLPTAVPEPASVGMFTSLALFGVGALRRKRGAKAA